MGGRDNAGSDRPCVPLPLAASPPPLDVRSRVAARPTSPQLADLQEEVLKPAVPATMLGSEACLNENQTPETTSQPHTAALARERLPRAPSRLVGAVVIPSATVGVHRES